MNLLSAASGGVLGADGAVAATAVVVQSGSTGSSIVLVAADAAKFTAGSKIAVDVDYTGQTGYVGTPIAGAYVRQPLTDVVYIRRVTYQCSARFAVSSTGLTLAEPLPAGVRCGREDAGDCRVRGSRRRKLLSGVVGAVRDGGKPGRENLLPLPSAAKHDGRGRSVSSAKRQAAFRPSKDRFEGTLSGLACCGRFRRRTRGLLSEFSSSRVCAYLTDRATTRKQDE